MKSFSPCSLLELACITEQTAHLHDSLLLKSLERSKIDFTVRLRGFLKFCSKVV